jgi:hypothetical protein
MRRRVLLIGGSVLVIGLAVLVYTLKTGDSAPSSTATPSERQSVATAQPQLQPDPAQANPKPFAIQRMEAAGVGPAPTSPVNTTGDARPGMESFRSNPMMEPAELAKAEARFEQTAKRKMTKAERQKFEEAFRANRTHVDVIPGTTKMRETLMPCTGPKADEQYSKLNDAGRAQMRLRCAKRGTPLPEPTPAPAPTN